MEIVFQANIDAVGMAIYGTELVLWIGVFVCGGYFNLKPWISSQMARRRRQREEDQQARDEVAGADGISMHRMPSSTSVFRTPSSVIERNSRPSAAIP